MIVISDTTPILSLIKIDRLKILEELYKKIIIPKAVYDELIINIDYQDEIDIIKRCTFIQIENVEENLSVVLLQRELKLDRGESEAIVLAKNINADLIIIDALNHIDTRGIPYEPIIKGDAKCYNIAAASILAKVTRDRIMRQWDEIYPCYGFSAHKGYGTARHIEAIKEYGLCPIHRRTFTKNFI